MLVIHAALSYTNFLDFHLISGGDFKTPYSLRITSIDYTKDFEDTESGKSKKLRDQLIPDVSLFMWLFLINQL